MDDLAKIRSLRIAGNLNEAANQCRQIVTARPHDADALHLLGSIEQARGRPAEAAAYLDRALAVRPQSAALHNDLGIALGRIGQRESALRCFQSALQLDPSSFDAHNNMGTILCDLGRPQEAVEAFRQAVRLRPDSIHAQHNLGVTLFHLGQKNEAIDPLEHTLRLQPDFPDGQRNLAVALRDSHRLAEAEQCFRRAIEQRPDDSDALIGLSLALYDQGRMSEAVAAARRAVTRLPGVAELHGNLGIMLLRTGEIDQAMACYRRAIRLKPESADAHWNRALALLLLGRFDEGWLEYEWRRKMQKNPFVGPLPQPLWDGSSLSGKTILLYKEQGAGDVFQMIRYAALLKAQGARVLFACGNQLLPILSSCPGIDQLVPMNTRLPPFDCHAPLMSVPGILETGLDSIPAGIPYLSASSERIDLWRAELASVPGFKIGIAWQGDPAYPGDRYRSIPLREFAPVAGVPRVQLINLQKGFGTRQLEETARDFSVLDLAHRLDPPGQAFMDTAAVMKCLDLVVTSDTAIAHLAGALGIRVWVVLGAVPDWRWLLDRPDSPWYPTMRLFRQREAGDWGPVFKTVAGEIQKLIKSNDVL